MIMTFKFYKESAILIEMVFVELLLLSALDKYESIGWFEVHRMIGFLDITMVPSAQRFLPPTRENRVKSVTSYPSIDLDNQRLALEVQCGL